MDEEKSKKGLYTVLLVLLIGSVWLWDNIESKKVDVTVEGVIPEPPEENKEGITDISKVSDSSSELDLLIDVIQTTISITPLLLTLLLFSILGGVVFGAFRGMRER